MSDNGATFFNAPKPNRQTSFSYRNQDMTALNQQLDGDQSAHVHPFPACLPPGQKVGMGPGEMSPEYTAGELSGRQ